MAWHPPLRKKRWASANLAEESQFTAGCYSIDRLFNHKLLTERYTSRISKNLHVCKTANRKPLKPLFFFLFLSQEQLWMTNPPVKKTFLNQGQHECFKAFTSAVRCHTLRITQKQPAKTPQLWNQYTQGEGMIQSNTKCPVLTPGFNSDHFLCSS